jgi:hypothetical protein
MPILNYTTKIKAEVTVSEIQRILARAGARSVTILYLDDQPEYLSFAVPIRGRKVSFRLPCRWNGVLNALNEQKVARQYRSPEHARRVAWRIVKDWVKAQMAIIESGQAELAEVFLPYAIHEETDQTLYERYLADTVSRIQRLGDVHPERGE